MNPGNNNSCFNKRDNATLTPVLPRHINLEIKNAVIMYLTSVLKYRMSQYWIYFMFLYS